MSDHKNTAGGTNQRGQSRNRRNNTASKSVQGGNNLPGILIGALFVLVEGWFFLRLLHLNFLPAKYMWLIGAGLVLLAGLVFYLCWNNRKKTKFILGAVLALLASAGLVIGSGVVDRVRGTIASWEAPSTDAQQVVAMGIYVLAEDRLQYVEDLGGEVIGIMEAVDRAEAEQVLDVIADKVNDDLQVRTFGGFAEVVNALYAGEIRAAILDQTFIDILSGISGYGDVSSRLRMISDVEATRPASASDPSGEDPAASTPAEQEETTTTLKHGSRSWRIIHPVTTEATETAEVPATELPEGPIETAPPPTAAPTAWSIGVPAGQEGRIFTVYISGLDTRGGGLASRGNSDVNILAVVNMNSRQVLLLSTPRDFFVPFPSAGGANDKLTHAGFYGVQASMDALRSLYGVTSQYYFRVGFEGFKSLVNALGGISVYSAYEFNAGEYQKRIDTPAAEAETDESGETVAPAETAAPQYETAYRYHFVAGSNTLDGDAALAFVRQRRNMPGGDRARGTNQMAVIKAVFQKMASSAMFANFGDVLGAVGGLAQTTLPYDTMAAFSRSVLNGDSWNVVSYSVNGSNGEAYSFSIGSVSYVMYPDYGTVSYARNLIQRVYNGEWVSP